MSKTSQFIDINGVRYDARTGEYVAHLYAPGTAQSTKPALKTAVKRPTMHDVVRAPAKHAAAHRPKGSKTLMRHAVKKPRPAKTKLVDPTLARRPQSDIAVKRSVKRVDDQRLAKARQIPQNKLIRHFAPLTGGEVQVARFMPAAATGAAEIIPVRSVASTKPAPVRKPRTTSDLLEHALRHASSHEQPPHKVAKKRRRGRATATAAACLIAVSLLGYQQLPNLKMRVASARAGIHAAMPGYHPAGYSLQQLDYSPGVVASRFHSNSDERLYTLTQKQSNWTSQELLENFVKPADPNYQAVETAGRTVYMYNASATWVSGGLWYQIQNDGSLTKQQLLQLAASL